MAGLLLTILSPILLWLLAIRLWAKFVELTADSKCKLPLPPGSFGLPFIGESLELAWRGYPFFRERRSMFGPVYKTYIMGRPTVQVSGSKNLQKIFSLEEVGLVVRWPQSARMLVGPGSLLASNGELHNIRRSCLSLAFTQKAVNGYLPMIQSVVKRNLTKWVEQGSIFGVKESQYLTADLASKCILGYEFSRREIYLMAESIEHLQKCLFSSPYRIPGSNLSKAMEYRSNMVALIERAVAHHLAESSHAYNNSVLVILLKSTEKDKLTPTETEDICIEMMFSTVIGVSSAICTMLLELARHENCAQRAMQELFHLDLLDNQTDGDLTIGKMADFDYIRRVVKELLRLTPPIGNGWRHVLKTTDIGGYQIPKGWTIQYSIRDQHETGTNNSNVFEPDRWLPERDITRIDEYLYIPFGGSGRRSCIGQKFAVMCLEVMTAETVRNCRWNLMDANPAMKYFPIPYPSDGLPLQISEAQQFRQRRVTV